VGSAGSRGDGIVSRFATRSENVSRGLLDGKFLGQIVTKMISHNMYQQMLHSRFNQKSKTLCEAVTRTEPMSLP
jgi:hypothetical protein